MTLSISKVMGIVITVLLVIAAIAVVVNVAVTNYYDQRTYSGIVKNMKYEYDYYQAGRLVDHLQVSEDCDITISKNGVDTYCLSFKNQENLDCEQKAINDGYAYAAGLKDMILDKTECKIRI